MAPRTLSPAASLDSIWSELAYTGARLAANPDAADFTAIIEPLLRENEQTQAGQRGTWQDELVAQARCNNLSDAIGDLVREIGDTLVFVVKDRQSPRVTRYLRQAPHATARLALEAKLKLVRNWPGSLTTEPEESLRVLGARLAESLERTDGARAALSTAKGERANFRLRVITPLVERVNAERLRLYGLLVGRAIERKLGKRWPDRFFVTKRNADRKASGDEG